MWISKRKLRDMKERLWASARGPQPGLADTGGPPFLGKPRFAPSLGLKVDCYERGLFRSKMVPWRLYVESWDPIGGKLLLTREPNGQ